MSMTQSALFQKKLFPGLDRIQDYLISEGHDFKFIEGTESLESINGIVCTINGNEVYFETNSEPIENFLEEYPELSEYSTDSDYALSFNWGANMLAGAGIQMISLALKVLSNATIIYVDEFEELSTEVLQSSIPEFLNGE